MGVTKYGFENVRNRIEQYQNMLDDDMLIRLQYLGESLCNHARTITKGHDSGGYDDHTGNLRSSIGYRILKDGNPVQEGGLQSVAAPEGRGKDGKKSAQSALDRFSRDPKVSKRGWTLIVVAGMNYAKYVEDKGYNVLYLTGIELEKEINELKKLIHP